MRTFHWLALTPQGTIQHGSLAAANLQQLEHQLLAQHLVLIEARSRTPLFRSAQKIKRRDLILFFNNLQQLCEAGVPLLDALHELAQIESPPQLTPIVQQLQQRIESGTRLSQAMAQQADIFDPIICTLIEVGEQSGELSLVLTWVADNLQWQEDLHQHTRQLLLYPCLVATLVGAASLFLMLYLVPQLTQLIQSLGMPLPWHTQALIFVSHNIQQYGWYLLAMFSLPPLLLQYASKLSPNIAKHRDRCLLKLWLVGPLLQQISLARFTQAIAIMYRAGINTLQCIQLARGLIRNRQLQQALDLALQQIEAGQNLSQSFQQTGLFPSLLIRMLRVGETTGGLDHALLQVSQGYDRNIRLHIKQAQALIEPCMTIALGLLLAWVVLAILSPLYDLIGNIPL